MDGYSVYSSAVKVVATGEGDLDGANRSILEFASLPPEIQYSHVSRWIGEDDDILVMYGWKLLEQLVRLITGPKEIETIGSLIEANFAVKIENEYVSRMKAAAFASMIVKVVEQKGLPFYIHYFSEMQSNDVNYAILEINIYKNLMIEMDSDVMSHRCKAIVQQDILPIVAVRVMSIVRSLRPTKDPRLFTSFASFVHALPLAMPQAGDAVVLGDLLLDLVDILRYPGEYSDKIIELVGGSILTLLQLRTMNVHQVLSRRDICEHLTNVWRMVEYDKGLSIVSIKTSISLQIILSYSEYLAQRKKNPETLPLAHLWLNAFVVVNSDNKENKLPIIRSLRILLDAFRIGGSKLFECMSYFKRRDIYTIRHPQEFEHLFWQQTFEAFRALIRCEATVMITTEVIIGSLANFILTGQCFSVPDSFAPLEGIFRTLKSATTQNQGFFTFLQYYSGNLTEFIDNFVSLSPSSEMLLFIVKIKTSIATALYKSNLFKSDIMKDIAFLCRVSKRNNQANDQYELIYLITSFVYNVVDSDHKFISQSQEFHQVTSDIRNFNASLSLLQQLPLIEAVIILDRSGSEIEMCKEYLRRFQPINNLNNIDAFLVDELGFDTDQPSEQQMLRRKGYRASLMYCRILLKRCGSMDRFDLLLQYMARPILCQLIIYNNWRKSTIFHPSYNTGLTKNDMLYIGVQYEETVGHISSEKHPNTYFETLGDTLFQLLEYAVLSGLEQCASIDSTTQELLNMAIPSDVGSCGPSFRRWLSKGYRCMATITPPEVIFSSLSRCSLFIVEQYKSLSIDSDGQPICDTEEEKEQGLLITRYFSEILACMQTVICSTDCVAVKEDGTIFYKLRDETEPFYESVVRCAQDFLVSSSKLFLSIIEINEYTSSRMVCRILSHAFKNFKDFDEKSSRDFFEFVVKLTGHIVKYSAEDEEIGKELFPVLILLMNSEHLDRDSLFAAFRDFSPTPLCKPSAWSNASIRKWIKMILHIE